MQGVIKSYDPVTGDGVLLCDTDFKEYDLAPTALEGSIFRMLRQGQRATFYCPICQTKRGRSRG